MAFRLILILSLAFVCSAQTLAPGTVTEYAIAYPHQAHSSSSHAGSTHEITFNHNGGNEFWITGQNYDSVVKVALDGKMTFYSTPEGSGPHGVDFDSAGRLWMTLEFSGEIVRLDPNGKIVAEYDVSLDCTTCATKINTSPHGLAIGSDGKTVWYTGKATGTVGKLTPDGKVHTYALPIVGSVPIYIKAGPDGNMWVTELVGNAIARVTPEGKVTEFPIPTHNGRPIAIIPEPDGKAMWFTEQAGNRVGRIDMDGKITEFAVPKNQNNVLLAGLSFDSDKNLWVEQYVDQDNPFPAGTDHIVKIDKSILTAQPGDTSKVPMTYYQVPTTGSVFHRIIQGPDGNMWFTEMHANKVGKLTIK